MTVPTPAALLDAVDEAVVALDAAGRPTAWNRTVAATTGVEPARAPVDAARLFGDDAERVREAGRAAVEGVPTTLEAALVGRHGPVAHEFRLTAVPDGDGDAPPAAVAVGRALPRPTRPTGRLAARERALAEMYGIVSDDDRDFEATVRGLLALGRTELGMSYGTLSRIRGEEYVFEVVDAAADADGVTEGDAVPLSATNCEITASERETLVLGDVARDAPGETDRAGYAEWGIACYLGAPVTVEDEVYGTFCFYDTESRPGGFGEWAVTLVDLMSRWVSYELSSRRTTDRLRRQNAKLERFASVLSHDLRNPLSVLRGSLDAAVAGDEAAVGRCRRAVDRMDELVEDVLAMARAGETVESPRPVDLGALASDCWTVVDTAAASLDLADAPTVAADEPRLRRLVENLLRNAVEHGGRDVTVTVGGLDDGDGFFVADDGAGIGPDERDRVLEHGYSTAPEGTGLGLSIVAEIASGHGWRLAVTESAAGGARFEFRGAGWSGPDAADTGPGRA